MSKKYGYFDDDRREYVITDPCTPVKWINYIGSLDFGGIIDQTGGSLLCAGDPGLNRITKYIPQTPASEFKGTTLYLRVTQNGRQEILAPFFTPCLQPLDHFECRVGLSYQRIESLTAGIRTVANIFVPPGEPVELRDIRITNERNDDVTVEIIPVVEYSHFDALKQLTNADWVPQTMMSESLDLEEGRLALLQYPFLRKDDAVNFLSADRTVDSFESDRRRFLGSNEYGTWRRPEALLEKSLSNHEARRGDNIGALLIPLGTLAPGEQQRATTMLGQGLREEVSAITAKYKSNEAVDQAFTDLTNFWNRNLSVMECHTPDSDFDSMVNIHNPRQCYMTMNWSRYLSLYQLGVGSRGIGFRDSSQDIMGALSGSPEDAKALLCKLLSIQRPDGSAMHQFYPATMEADAGDAQEENDKLVYGDDHLWIVPAVCAYLKETGDYDFLNQTITFYEQGVGLSQRVDAPVFDHLERALAFTKTNVGSHGLPLLGFADWNDTVNLPGKAESLFNACLYGLALTEMMELCKHLGNEKLATRYLEDHEAMSNQVNQEAWDGDWYVRYFTEEGQALGSANNTYGSIYTNAQSWPVLAGFAPPERAKKSLDAVRRHLNTKFGIKLSSPGYDAFDPMLGGVTTYPPGAKENGGIFLHSNPWMMIAETKLGRGDQAFEYYSQINPAKRNSDLDLYQIEPYCYAQNILGDEHPEFGLGRNSWLSGTASWAYQAAVKHILGIRPTHEGLIIDPCIPKDWTEFTVTRRLRGATYQIKVLNPENVNRGAVSITVDGKKTETEHVPYFDGGEHVIEILLGGNSDHAQVSVDDQAIEAVPT